VKKSICDQTFFLNRNKNFLLFFLVHEPFQSFVTFVDSTDATITVNVSSTPGVQSYIVTASDGASE